MSYLDETLQPGERVFLRAHFHWTYTLTALLALLFLGIFIIGIFIFVAMMVTKWTTEIAVTSERLIYKRGLIARRVDEVAIDKIESVSLNQSLIGRIFGFGALRVRGTGNEEIRLPEIDRPIAFRRAIGEARAALHPDLAPPTLAGGVQAA